MLADKLKMDMNQALKAGDRLRLSVLRMLVSELGYKRIDLGRELSEDEVEEAIRKEIKKRKEAIAAYTAGGRGEQAQLEEQEMHILLEYSVAHG